MGKTIRNTPSNPKGREILRENNRRAKNRQVKRDSKRSDWFDVYCDGLGSAL